MPHAWTLRNEALSNLKKLAKDANYRHSNRSCIVSGSRLVSELNTSQSFHSFVSSCRSLFPSESIHSQRTVTSRHLLRDILELGSDSPHIAGVCSIPREVDLNSLRDCRRCIAFEGIACSRLVASVLRVAMSFQFDRVFFVKSEGVQLDRVYPELFDPEFTRVSDAALFHLNYSSGTLEAFKRVNPRSSVYHANSGGVYRLSGLPENSNHLILVSARKPPRNAVSLKRCDGAPFQAFLTEFLYELLDGV